jgi:hypothetical protein
MRLADLIAFVLPLVFGAGGTFVATQTPPQPTDSRCSTDRLVGTWERISLLRNGLSVQPPDAPLFLKFGSDGYWSMMEMPDDRPKIDKPLDQLTAQDLLSRFDKVEGGQGTWTVKADGSPDGSPYGSIVTRRHFVNIAPGGEGSNQDRLCWFEGDILALVGTGPNRSPQARFKRLANHKSAMHSLVGTWERTSLNVDGKPSPQPAALLLILGEDGWYSQTQLPRGRKPAGKPIEQFTVDDYVASFGGVSAARGTYTVQGNTLTRRYIANVDPNLVGRDNAAEFTLMGETVTLRGSSTTGAKFESTFTRLKRLETTVK